MFKPRPNQAEILEYDHGKMGISAVPGSGKTFTLSFLAAQLILRGKIETEQEILIVTLVNSAVENFSSRIAGFIRNAGLLENVGYRVRTLHGLAHDIVREKPELAGVSNQFSIADDVETYRMIEQISVQYARQHPEVEDFLVKPEIEKAQIHHKKNGWDDLITRLNQDFISQAKDLDVEPDVLAAKMQKRGYHDVLLDMAVDVYSQYQRGLKYRNALDFSDLILLANRALNSDAQYLERLRKRWPYILEDEAQDSSRTQEAILRLLTGADGNWVRVGDPNQAIYETFTTASPKYLRQFLNEPGVKSQSLPHSGRSCPSIIDLSNALIDWTRESHPVMDLRQSLDLPHIQPTPAGDPQPNPPDRPNAIYIRKNKLSPEKEVDEVVTNIKNYLQGNQDKTIAVLCPIGFYADKVVDALQNADIPTVEMLKSSQSTRKTARVIEKILTALSSPSSVKHLIPAFTESMNGEEKTPEEMNLVKRIESVLKKITNLEDFFYPPPEVDWEQTFIRNEIPPEGIALLNDFRQKFIRWHQASVLPIDQLVLTIAQDLFTSPAELALAHKLALALEFADELHPEFELINFANELADISGNARRFSGFSDADVNFDPDVHKGEVFVSTFHKAKGMEWDRVYLLSVSNYDFPSAQPNDQYISEKWYIRENFNPQAELLEKLSALAEDDVTRLMLPPGNATLQARLDYSAERLRLLFVGITRARESLIITWNTGTREGNQMALPLEALHAMWNGQS